MSSRLSAILTFAVMALAIAGCGDDDVGDPIPQGKKATLESQLDAVRNAADQDLCDDAATAVNQARATVDSLDDDGVGSDVQDALGDGVDNLGSLVTTDCEQEEEVETTPETETVAPPPTETVEPPPTETLPPTDTVEPEPIEPEPEPDEGDGGAQFDPDALPPGQEKKGEDD